MLYCIHIGTDKELLCKSFYAPEWCMNPIRRNKNSYFGFREPTSKCAAVDAFSIRFSPTTLRLKIFVTEYSMTLLRKFCGHYRFLLNLTVFLYRRPFFIFLSSSEYLRKPGLLLNLYVFATWYSDAPQGHPRNTLCVIPAGRSDGP